MFGFLKQRSETARGERQRERRIRTLTALLHYLWPWTRRDLWPKDFSPELAKQFFLDLQTPSNLPDHFRELGSEEALRSLGAFSVPKDTLFCKWVSGGITDEDKVRLAHRLGYGSIGTMTEEEYRGCKDDIAWLPTVFACRSDSADSMMVEYVGGDFSAMTDIHKKIT